MSEPAKFSRHPLVFLSALFAAGIVSATLISLDWRLSLFCAVLFSLMSILVKRGAFFIAIAFVFLGAFCFQFENFSVREDRLKRVYDEGRIVSGEPVQITGVVQGKPEPAYDGAFVRLSVKSLSHKQRKQSATGIARLFVPLDNSDAVADFEELDLRSGSQIRVACNLIREDQYQNPGVIPRRQILDAQGVDATATVKSPLLIEKIGQDSWPSPINLVHEQRRWLIDEFRSTFNAPTAGVMIASLLGDKYFLDRGTAEIFREGGTFHVLVISGLHITFIGGMVLWIVSRFTRNRASHLAIVGSILWAYTIAVGAETPVMRAAMMFTAFLFSRAIYRDGNLPNTLGLCCLILLVWRPSELFNPSFQLTVVSVAAIVGMAFPLIENLRAIGSWIPDSKQPFPPNVPAWLKRFCEMLYWREAAWSVEKERQIWSATTIFKQPAVAVTSSLQRVAAYIFEGLLVSVIVQLWMLPLLIYYFHRVSPISILLNLWVGIIIAIESFAAIIAVVFAQISEHLAAPVVFFTEFLNWLLISVPGVFTKFDLATFRVPIYAGGLRPIYLIYFVPLILLTLIVFRWNPFRLGQIRRLRTNTSMAAVACSLVTFVIAAVMILHPFSAPEPDGKLRVEFLDVGQGDSAFVTFPNGETMLIDGGGRASYARDDNEDDDIEPFEPDAPRIGEMVVSEFLWEKGYSRVDYLVATHADADHAQGLEDIVRNFNVGTLYVGEIPEDKSEMDGLLNEARRNEIHVKQISRGNTLEIGGVRIEILWPAKDISATLSDNDRSVTMRLIYGDHAFLLTGDIEREAEAALTADPQFLKADIVKIPHHGSRTSSTDDFVNAVAAHTAVVSVGRRSMFGHPHREVVNRWQASGANVMTTGERGTVTFVTDGTTFELETYLK